MTNLAKRILLNWEEILLPLLPDGEVQGAELVARNPRREDKSPGSFRLNLESGAWADFALEGVRGADALSFLTYVTDTTPAEARTLALGKLAALGGAEVPLAPSSPAAPDPAAEGESEAILPVPAGAGNPPLPDRYGYPVKEFRYRDADGRLLLIVRRYDTAEGGKAVVAWTYRTPGQWEPKKPPKPWPLYGLDRLAKNPTGLVLLAEGEKTADAAERLLPGVGVTTLNGSGSAKDADLEALTGREIVLLPDADEPGRKYAVDLIERLKDKARTLRVMDVWSLGWKDGKDVADVAALPDGWLDQALSWDAWLTPEDVSKIAERQTTDTLKEQVEALAQLDPMVYEVRRGDAAAALGVRTVALDKWVQARRAELFPPEDQEQGERLVLEDPEPWPEPVAGDALAEAVRDVLLRHCILPDGAAEALVLFAFHTWAFAAADVSPHLVLVSPVKRSGKTTTLAALAELVSKPLRAEDCTTAALFRAVEAAEPCLLIDEADAFARGDEQLRGLLNSSFQRGGGVLRVVGDALEVRRFKTFSPTVLASIGDLPATIMDRALVIRMKRKAHGERVAKFRRGERAACLPLRRKLRRWAADNVEALPEVRPEFPPCLNDREADAWEPLLQIAALLGPKWEELGLLTARTLACAEETADAGDLGLDLLADVRALVLPLGVERVTSEWLRYELGGLEGRPWSTLTDRGLVSQLDLARLLKPFEIKPLVLRLDHKTAKRPEQTKATYRGFKVEQFRDAWDRYLGPHAPEGTPTSQGTHASQGIPTPEGTHVSPYTSGNPVTSVTPVTSATAAKAGKTAKAKGAAKGGRTDGADTPEESPEPLATGAGTATGTATVSPVTGVTDVTAFPEDKEDKGQGVSGAEGSEELSGEGLTIVHPVTGAPVPVLYLATDPGEAAALVRDMVESGAVLGVDTETTGLDPRTAALRLVQITDGALVLVLDLLRLGVPAADVLLPLEGARAAFFNVAFDLGFLLAAGLRLREPSCAQLAAAALTHDPMLSLAKAAERFLGVEVAKEEQRSDWTRPDLSPGQVRYAALDALLTLALHRELMTRLKNQRTVRGFTLVRQAIPAIADAKARGVLLDRAAHAALVKAWTGQRDTALETLRGVIGPDLNPESGPQLAQWLADHLEEGTRASWPTTPKGQMATDRDTLEAFADVALVRPLLDYRRVSHRLKTWGEAYLRHITPEGRIHPGFLLLGARSGRMSCRSPNVQNLPRDPALRACFIAPPGFRIMAADYGQIELRTAGLLSGDPVIRAAYEGGHDLHREIVARVTGRPVAAITDGERKLGKALNFGLLYGAGARTFRTRARVDYGLEITLEEAEAFKRVFDSTYAALRWWQGEQQRDAQSRGWIKTPGGRRVSFRDPADCYTDSRNYPIQAAAADLQLLAIQRTHAALVEAKAPAYLVNFVHDELVLEVREDVLSEVAALVQAAMTGAFLDLFKDHDPEPLARGLVEVGSGPNYGEAK